MKLRNKKTGEIWTLTNRNEGTSAVLWVSNGSQTHVIESIEELANNFEDYEEPKDYWWIRSGMGDICEATDGVSCHDNFRKSIGNCFETKEEAEKAVEKLKAFKRLRDKGIKTVEWTAGLGDDNYKIGEVMVGFDINGVHDGDVPNDIEKDLDLLFGGEE